jgi:hypothetical protein
MSMTASRNPQIIEVALQSVLQNPSRMRHVRGSQGSSSPSTQALFYPGARALESYVTSDKQRHPERYTWTGVTIDDYARILRILTLTCHRSKITLGKSESVDKLNSILGSIALKNDESISMQRSSGITRRVEDFVVMTYPQSKLDKFNSLLNLATSRDKDNDLHKLDVTQAAFSTARIIAGHRNEPTIFLSGFSEKMFKGTFSSATPINEEQE